MHIKYAYLPGERDDELLVRAVKPGKQPKGHGLLPQVQEFVEQLPRDDRYTYTLDNAMGYSEFYGANSNTDWYGYNSFLEFNGLLNAPLNYGRDPNLDKAMARAWPYGYPTFLNAAVFAHHDNKDAKELGFGDVLFATANPRMKRIELVKRVFNEVAVTRGHTSILNRLNAGERVDVSMGTKIPFDLCSICTDWALVKKAWKTFDPELHAHPGIGILAYHRTVAPIRGLAVTKDDYCVHMKTQKGQILPDGRKVFVFNDFCRFFDISFVWVGADRTARVMWFLSPANMPKVESIQGRPADPTRLLAEAAAKLMQMKTSGLKTSELTKELSGGYAQAILDRSSVEPSLATKGLETMSSKMGPQSVLSSLAALGIVLKPNEFTAVVKPHVAALQKVANQGFNTDLPGIDDTCAVDPKYCQYGMMKAASGFIPTRSSYAPYLKPRLVPLDRKDEKHVDFESDPIWDKVASMYNGYRISVLEKSAELAVAGTEILDLTPGFAEKRAGSELALLLLGLGPVVHLIASHLEKERGAGRELGAMESFVADNPTFTSIATIGAGLRAAMGIQQAGGILPAASALFRAARTVL